MFRSVYAYFREPETGNPQPGILFRILVVFGPGSRFPTAGSRFPCAYPLTVNLMSWLRGGLPDALSLILMLRR
jgi:hypothetical protein